MRASAAILALFAVSGARAGSIHFEEFGPFSVRSTSGGELSSGIQELPVHTTAELQVKYAAPVTHCSSLRMHFLLDGVERGVSGAVAPGKSSGFFDFGAVSAGEHVVGLRSEGIPGGCNAGKLDSWGGSVVVRSSREDEDGLDARAAALGAEVYYSTTVSFGFWRHGTGVFVTQAGDAYGFDFDPDGPGAIPLRDRNAEVALFDLQQSFSHDAHWLGKLDAQSMKTCQAALESLPETRRPNRDPRNDAPVDTRGSWRLRARSGKYAFAPCAAEGS